MKKIGDLAVAVGEYQKNGETKRQWQNVGSLMEKDGNQFLFLSRSFNPAGVPNPENRSDVLISIFEPKQKGERQQGQGGGGNEDIPFAPYMKDAGYLV